MYFLVNIALNIYSILLLLVILWQLLKHMEQGSLSDKLFLSMLLTTILMLIFDSFGRFDGHPQSILYPVLNAAGNFLIFLLVFVLPSLWLLYVHYQVFYDIQSLKRLLLPLILLNSANAVFVALNPITGLLYAIDEHNIYSRGPLYLITSVIGILMLITTLILVLFKRKSMNRRYFYSLAFFSLPPFLSIIASIYVYGLSIMLNSVVISILIVFLNIQNHNINTDYLTGIHNRKRLEAKLREKVASSDGHRTFSAIMLDLDNFKEINDTYGHDMGDQVLKTATELLKSSIRSKDFIARFGGDEFCIILDIGDQKTLEAAVHRIKKSFLHYNEGSQQPFKLDVSLGSAVYDPHSSMKAEEFQKQIDQLMYKNKMSKKTQ